MVGAESYTSSVYLQLPAPTIRGLAANVVATNGGFTIPFGLPFVGIRLAFIIVWAFRKKKSPVKLRTREYRKARARGNSNPAMVIKDQED